MTELDPVIHVELTHAAIDTQAVQQFVATTRAGALVLFLGTVREFTDGRQTNSLDYEAYPEMARREIEKLIAETNAKWPVLRTAVVHRLGRLELGDVAVAVAVSSPHRQAAFAAAEHLMNRIKESVPIWKRERWSDGTTEWVHPGLPTAATTLPAATLPAADSTGTL